MSYEIYDKCHIFPILGSFRQFFSIFEEKIVYFLIETRHNDFEGIEAGITAGGESTTKKPVGRQAATDTLLTAAGEPLRRALIAAFIFF